MPPSPDVPQGTLHQPVPDEAVVLRACRLPPDYEPGDLLPREAFDFSLSSLDKQQPIPLLSVFVRGLTTEAQVCALVGDGTTHRLVACLEVSAIRQIFVEDYRLDVMWDAAVFADGSPDTRPGANGHAGIAGLHRPPNASKFVFRALQTLLADAVGQNYMVVNVA